MSTFTDDDPEDAWSAGDPPRQLVPVLIRWTLSIAGELAEGDPKRRSLARIHEATDHAVDLSIRSELTPVERALVGSMVDLLLALEGLAPHG